MRTLAHRLTSIKRGAPSRVHGPSLPLSHPWLMMVFMPVISSITVDTPIGPIGVTATADGIVGTAFGGVEGTGTTNRLRAGHLAQATEELDEYFHGDRRDFTVPLDWSASAGWALTVRRCLLSSVGYGETVSYGRLAALANRPDGARAVGGILAGNPIAVLVPCHRSSPPMVAWGVSPAVVAGWWKRNAAFSSLRARHHRHCFEFSRRPVANQARGPGTIVDRTLDRVLG